MSLIKVFSNSIKRIKYAITKKNIKINREI